MPTATFRVMYVFVILRHDRREIVHFNAMYHPTAEWAAQQIVEAFPLDSAPRYLLHDRDSIYGKRFRTRVKSLDIEEVVTAPRSPWQNPYVELSPQRANILGIALSPVAHPPGDTDDLQAGHSGPMASQRFSTIN